jgi:DNA-binding GntR family transcriptional regulator
MNPNPFASVTVVARASTAEQVAAGVRQLILSGEISPNTPLKETELAAAFGTSRNTVRETLLLLTHEGLVQRSRHRGAVVAAHGADDIRDVSRARKVLELAAVDAVERTPGISLAPLAAALSDLVAAVERDNWDEIPLADAMFHRALVSLQGSSRLTGMYDQLLSEIRLATLISGRTDASEGQSVVDEHRRVHDMLEHGRFDDCRAELSDMIDETERRLLRTFSATEQ